MLTHRLCSAQLSETPIGNGDGSSGSRPQLVVLAAASLQAAFTRYAITIVNGTRHSEQAKSFIIGLLSGAGRDALDSQGFGLPPSGPV